MATKKKGSKSKTKPALTHVNGEAVMATADPTEYQSASGQRWRWDPETNAVTEIK